MKQPELYQLIEAVLFAAAAPVTLGALAEALDVAEEDAVAALDILRRKLAPSGLRLAELAGSYQLVTAPEAAPAIERLLGNEARADLSRPALETLAIVIYRQPVTRTQIEAIRGIASEQMIRNLLQRDLIAEAGASDEPGKPPLYRPSIRLLQHLGVASLDELPPLEELLGNDAA